MFVVLMIVSIIANNLDHRISVEESDPTPTKFDESVFIERSGQDSRPEADRGIPRSQSAAAFSQTDRVDYTPVTRCYSSRQLERIYPGNL